MGSPRMAKVFGAVNVGSFRISAMIIGRAENGELSVLGSSHRKSLGVKRGYIADMNAASDAVRDAVERAEIDARMNISGLWVNCAGAGLSSSIAAVEIPIGGRRIEEDDVEHLLYTARDHILPDGRTVLHAHPAYYTLDGAHGIANPKGLHAETLGVDIHVMLADGAPIRNLVEAVQSAHLDVEGVIASPLAASRACLSSEERELGAAIIEVGAELTNVSVHAGGMVVGMRAIPYGSAAITDAVASGFGIRRDQAERLKCVHGSAIASPSDNREMIPLAPVQDGGEGSPGGTSTGAANLVKRAELVAIVTSELERLTSDCSKALKEMGFTGPSAGQIVLTGGGADLAGVADYVQGALGRPVRIGRPPALRGLPEAHANPGFATLAGLCLYASDEPTDIRAIEPNYQSSVRYAGGGVTRRVLKALKEYF